MRAFRTGFECFQLPNSLSIEFASTRRDFAISRSRCADSARACCGWSSLETKGAGNAGCPMHPQPRVRNKKARRVSHYRFTGQSGIPRTTVLTAYGALSPVTGLFCHRRLQITICELDASVGASGPHAFAVRVRIARLATCRVHHIPHSTSVDDRDTPL